MKISQKKTVEVDAKSLKIHIKVSDGFSASLWDSDGCALIDYEGYVPAFMPGDPYGDYVILDIDIDTGMITNWKKPGAKDIEAFISDEEEE